MTARLTRVARRAATGHDSSFLRDHFAERRDDLLVLPRDSRDLIVDMQYRAARARRELDHPGATTEILIVDDVPVGVLVLERLTDSARIVELAVRVTARGRGFGSSVVGQLCADTEGLRLDVRVWTGRPRVRTFFERHGFVEAGTSGAYADLCRAA